MSKCPHGVFLGVGCKHCPQGGTESAIRKSLVRTATLITKKMDKEEDLTNNSIMGRDAAVLMGMASRY